MSDNLAKLSTEQLLIAFRRLPRLPAGVNQREMQQIESYLEEARRRDLDRMTIYAFCLNALHTDGAHHKQWFLEQIVKLASEAPEHERLNGEWKPGIAP